ncbi:collagen alpha-4(VI) chain-like [Perca flavescens]|uniref:collagen alpha-4(VI) chain-like n=1 Tax=Perca flavescens TaxID=8167 RepID=UPI00106E1640|nr:collagen alpha-4(VI) chain-like [Perca flavescens]
MMGRTSFAFSLIIAALLSGIAAQRRVCRGANIADIVFIVDESGSIGQENFKLVRNFLHSIVSSLDVRPNKVQVGIVTYNETSTARVYLNTFDNKKGILQFIKILPYNTGGTKTGAALNFTRDNIFIEEKGSRKSKGVQQVAVVITDGESQDSVLEAAISLRRDDVTVYSVGIKDANMEELRDMASQPTDRHVFNVKSFTELEVLKHSLQKVICENIIDQDKVIARESEAKKALAERYADIFFLVDSGIAQGQFVSFKNDLVRLINQINAGVSTYRVGVAQYGQDTQVEFLLNAHQTKQQLLSAVRGFRLRPQPNQPRNLGRALQNANTRFFTSEAGGRAHLGARQFLVVVSGRDSDDPVSKEAQKIKSAGVTVVGMSAGASMDALLRFVSSEYAFDSPRVLILKDSIMTEKKDDITEACKIGDIVFLLDQSGSIDQDGHNIMKNFTTTLVDSFEVGEDLVRVGLCQFSDKPKDEFYLNKYYNKEDLNKHILEVDYTGGDTYLGLALDHIKEYFEESQGSRDQVPKNLVVITDGDSHDDVEDAAEVLRDLNITVFAIGVGDVHDMQLLQIAGTPERMFAERNYDVLHSIKQRVVDAMCDDPNPPPPSLPTDSP